MFADPERLLARIAHPLKGRHQVAFRFVQWLTFFTVIAICDHASASPLTPLITPDGGYYKATGGIQAALQCPGPAASIYYTTDGTTPTPSHGTEYVPGSPISIPASLTLQAIAYDGINSSAVASATFTISTIATVARPIISPNGGNYTTGPVTVTLSSATSDASIYYTTDGTVPTINSTAYAAPFSLTSTATIRAIAVKSGMVNSGIAGSSFVLGYSSACAIPTMSPNGGAFTGSATVTISSSTPNAVIRYTTDGSVPTAASTQYTGPKFLGVTTTLTARAFATGFADSQPVSTTFTADTNAPTQLNVQSYGASTTATDNTSAVQAALNAAANFPRVHVYFPTGTYQFNSAVGLTANNTNNLVIDGQGSTLVFANAVGPLALSACNNVNVENMIIDSALPTATPGTVTESDSTGFDCLLDPGFLAVNVTSLPAMPQIDPTQRTPARLGYDIYSTPSLTATSLGPNKVRVATTTNITQGSYLNLRQYTYTNYALAFSGCDGVNVDNVTMYSGTGEGIIAVTSADISLVNVNTLVKPDSGRISSNASDATHFNGCKGLISYRDCQFQSQGDDALNVCGTYYTIKSVNYGSQQINIFNQFNETAAPTIQVGEVIQFRSGSTLQTTGSATVTAIAQLGGSPPVEQLTLASAPPSGITVNSDAIDSLTWLSRLSITRCNFLGNRARGMLIQTPNVCVQNCRFQDVSGAGVHVSTVLNPWYESTGTSNVQILNNSFENCNYGAAGMAGTINVYADNQSGALAPAGVHTGIVIADNTIRDTDNAGIIVSSADNADVLNNTIENVAIHPTFTNGSEGIYALNAGDVRINKNVGVQSNYLRFAANSWLPYWNPPASGQYNVQPFVIGFSQTAQHMAQWNYSWNVQSPLPTGQAVFVRLCNSAGSTVYSPSVGTLGDPSTWQNGPRLVSATVPVDLTSVPDGSYTIRMGINSATTGTRLQLLGDDDGSHGIIVGTLTLAGNGTAITFASQQFDVTPSISQFVQTGPRQFNIAYTWNVHDTIPTGESTFAQICNSSGTILQVIPTETTPDPSMWALGTQEVSTTSTVTLANSSTIPDGNYTLRVGLFALATGSPLPLSGQSDSSLRVITGTITTNTGSVAPIGWDSGSTTNITASDNTVVSLPVAITSEPPPTTVAFGSPYNFTYTATANATTGNTAPTFSLASGSLPPGLVLTSSGTLSGTPTRPGTYTGTVTATSGTVSGTAQSFTISVVATYPQWASYFQLTGSPGDTPMNDGVPNMLKYLYDIDPTAPLTPAEREALPVLGINTTTYPGTNYLTLTFRDSAATSGITIHVQTSPDLQAWTTVTPGLNQQVGTDAVTGDPIIETGVIATGATQFIRLNVVQP